MKWRPEGWEGITEYLFISDIDRKPITIYIPPYKKHRESEIYEAGADAMLEALKKEGQHLSTEGSFPYGLVLARTMKRGEHGTIVFIPDDKEQISV